MYRLKHDFYKLKEMGIEIQNFDVIYCSEIKKKWLTNFVKIQNNKKTKFKNKNTIGMMCNKYIVLDIDLTDTAPYPDIILDMIPKDTACEKTPNGYHYYFENDTIETIKTKVKLDINNISYSVDLLGSDAVVYMSPSCIGGKEYYWINSIFTHKPAKLSENMWICDLIKDKKPFYRNIDSVDIKINITNALIIVDNIFIHSQVHFIFGNLKQYSKKFKYFDGYVYVYDDNYYFLTHSSFKKNKNKTYLLNEMRKLVAKIKPSCIIDLSFITSKYYTQDSIFQLSSAVIDNNYKNYKNISPIYNYIELDKSLIHKTKYFIEDTTMVINPNTKEITKSIITEEGNKSIKLFGSESIYISLLLSSEFNIPNLTLGIIKEKSNDIKELHIKTSKKIFNSFINLF